MGMPCSWNNGTQTCTEGGCSQYSGDKENCMNHGCIYKSDVAQCFPPMSGGGGGGNIIGSKTCWFADRNPNGCMNVSGCVYCSNNNNNINAQLGGGNISNSLSFCYNKDSLCEGHQSDASGIEKTQNKTAFNVSLATDDIECSDIKLKQICNCGPFPMCKWSNSSANTGNYCEFLNRTKSDDEMADCRPKINGQDVKFCEDPKVTNEGNCTWLNTNFNMPCKWDSTNSKCTFMFESIFKGGPVGDLWEIDNTNGGETACLAAKGQWTCEDYEDDTGYIIEDCFCKMGSTKSGAFVENCDSFCPACEFYYSNGSSVTSLAASQASCANSLLGYCKFEANSNAPNGYGFCITPIEFKFGGGDCKTDCKSCDFVSENITKKQQSCEASPALCTWVNNSFGGFCQSSVKKSCDSDCMACNSQNDCQGSPLQCEWESNYNYCKAQGFNGEICFDMMDNDGDNKMDCEDADCVFNEFCGGNSMGDCGKHKSLATCNNATITFGAQLLNCTWSFDKWANASRCANPGEQCWMFDTNLTGCGNATGCSWINLSLQGENFCDINKTMMNNCFSTGNNQTLCNQSTNCVWISFGPGDPGHCEFAIFPQCGQLNSSQCQANTNCTWKTEFFMGNLKPVDPGMEGGHCEPACFNENWNASQCASKGFCESRTSICEPSFFVQCYNFDGNKTGCEAQPMCQWYNNTGEALCDPKMGDKFGNVGFGGGGGPSGLMDNNMIGAFEFFHLGDDARHDFNYTAVGLSKSNNSHNETLEAVDIRYFGIKDLGQELGVGIGVTDTKKSAFCNGKPDHWPENGQMNNTGRDSVKYYWYFDSDGNETNNCNATDQQGNKVRGFEFLITLYSVWDSNTNKSSETKSFFKCANGFFSPTSVAVYFDKSISCQMIGGAGVAVEKEDLEKFPALYNSTKSLRIFVASSTEVNNITDSAGPGYFTHGTVDFKPECCLCPGNVDQDNDGKPASTDEECTFIKQKGFVSFEDCFNSKDDNNDGLSDCNDPICAPMPKCGGSFNFGSNANDKKAPTVIFQKVDEWADGAFVKFDTDEPANGSVKFYKTDSLCATVNVTLNDLGDPTFNFDDYKPFHGIGITQNSVGYSLNLSTTYYYKLKVCDPSNNCGESACLNFTTKSSFKKVLFDIDLDSGYSIDFECNGFNKTNWNGEYAIKVNLSVTKNCNLTIKCSNGDYEIKLVGVDLTAPLDLNLQDKLVCNTTAKMIGMDSGEETWHNVLYDLGLGGSGDYIQEEFPVTYDSDNQLFHCDEDNVSDCDDITNYATCSGSSTTLCKVPTSIGFSGQKIEVASSNNQQTPSTSSGGGGGGTSTLTYVLTAEQLSSGFTKLMAKNERLKFAINNVNHYLTINSVSTDSATITVNSTSQTLTLNVGENKNFELTDDNYYDINVKLVRINSNKSEIYIKAIKEEIKKSSETKTDTETITGNAVTTQQDRTTNQNEQRETNQETGSLAETSSKGFGYIWIILLVLIIIIIVVIIILFIKKRR
jgi:hypothetical protein